MENQISAIAGPEAQTRWVRLDTLARLRWLAVAGQLAAITLAHFGLGLQINLWLCYAVVAVSAGSNLLGRLIFPRSRRLAESEALLLLSFDAAQLSLLLFLTGGLNNPFALLLLAPVTIAATVLRLRSMLVLGALVLALATLLAFAHEPILDRAGDVLELPELFRFGFWAAIVVGVAFIGLYLRSVAAEKQALAEALQATQLVLSREQKMSEISGVVAAAAHELGTPLATIKLASGELVETLADRPEALDDALLIREQVERCHAILRSMGSAGKEDLHLRQAPLEAILQEAAAPHAGRGKQLHFALRPAATDTRMPELWRNPGLIHGLRNLIQNAVDFARTDVWIEAEWDADSLLVEIGDNGPGFPAHLLGRIGEPFLRERPAGARGRARPAYQGMGLGLFIAKTLLERSGAQVQFGNRDRVPGGGSSGDGGRGTGAVVRLRWPRAAIEARPRPVLGQNRPRP
ncbi:MAG: ActS/PrrB/RegB family redox-sensitive histidine kinase [Pararhodobacter sp.]|nr:ActS/PrrB/RegB family redox-sensitive histidine kinase [Pararhodobacter sp.]